MEITKRELGIGNLFGVGLALLGSLLGYLWYTRESPVVVLVGLGTAIVLLTTISYVGFLFFREALPETFVWGVSQWFTAGLGLACFSWIGLLLARPGALVSTLPPSLVVVTVASGGAIGASLGLIHSFRRHYRKVRTLYQRNTVMNRVLRHNIRNEMNVILGYAEILAEEPEDVVGPAEVIERHTNRVISLSRGARAVDSLANGSDEPTVDIVSVTEQYLETARAVHPEAVIEDDLPSAGTATVNPLFHSVLDNLVENAIEHHDGDPSVRVSVDVDEPAGWATLRVADDGPGIPASQRDVLFQEREGSTQHGNGLGLWIVKWFADQFDGELWFEPNEPRGSVVCLRLPVA